MATILGREVRWLCGGGGVPIVEVARLHGVSEDGK